jgi:tripartite ATP-independent transporter DctM subunit
MSPLDKGLFGVLAILVLIGLRVPIGVSLGVVSFAGITSIIGLAPALSMLGRLPYEFSASWEFSAVPMFLLMGGIAFLCGMTTSLYKAARLWLGGLPGGLAVATNFASALFGAACGSSLATVVAMGRIGIPEMRRYGYDPGLATAVCACGGTLAALIPPSIPFIVYGILAEQSVAKLFLAGVVPGILTALAYTAIIVVRCSANPALAPRLPDAPSWAERFKVLGEIWPLPVLILGVIGVIYGGFATPTEAGAFGAALAIVIAATQGQLDRARLRRALRDAAVTTAVIMFVAIGAVMLSRFLALTGLPKWLAATVTAWQLSPLLLILVTSMIYLVLGCFLDPVGLMLLTIPIFLPLFQALGYDLVWLGVIIVKFIEIGLLTPPVGLNVYAAKTLVPDIGLEVIFRGVAPFLIAEAVVMALLFGFPQLSLFLPGLMTR